MQIKITDTSFTSDFMLLACVYVCFKVNLVIILMIKLFTHKKIKSDKNKIKLLYENRIYSHRKEDEEEKRVLNFKINYDWPLFERCYQSREREKKKRNANTTITVDI